MSVVGGGSHVNFHANSEENLQKLLKNQSELPESELRWCFYDWEDYEMIGDNEKFDQVTDWLIAFFEDPDEITIEESFRRQGERTPIINKAMVLAMQALIETGCFGTESSLDGCLFCVWGCDDDNDGVLKASLPLLNTATALETHASIYQFI